MSKKEIKKWKKDIWQFVIDHAKQTKDGYDVSFKTSGYDNFWTRIKARERGYVRPASEKYKLMKRSSERNKEFQMKFNEARDVFLKSKLQDDIDLEQDIQNLLSKKDKRILEIMTTKKEEEFIPVKKMEYKTLLANLIVK